MQFTTPDNKIIYGTYDSVGSDTLLIFVHGLTGSQNEHMYYNAVKYFNNNNFDTFRFNFYTRKSNARQLSECNLKTHVDDLNLIISNFKHKKKILIGHSLGCIAIMKANHTNINQLILWDPTSKLQSLEEKNIIFNHALGKYILNWGREILVGEDMIEDWKTINEKELLNKINIPYYFIFAGNHSKFKSWNFIDSSQYVIVPGATHRFIEPNTLDILYEQTLQIIKN